MSISVSPIHFAQADNIMMSESLPLSSDDHNGGRFVALGNGACELWWRGHVAGLLGAGARSGALAQPLLSCDG